MSEDKKIEFTKEQQIEMCEIIEAWYLSWKSRITDHGHPHYLGFARQDLKNQILDI
jgi:hypothetical protein